MTKYFKVVRSYDLSSCCLNDDFPNEFRVFYKLNEWVSPVIENTRLFVFKTLDDARCFISSEYFSHGTISIYECEVKNPQKVKYMARVYLIQNYWKKIFEARKNKKKTDLYDVIRYDTPKNTYSATQIKLLREVK